MPSLMATLPLQTPQPRAPAMPSPSSRVDSPMLLDSDSDALTDISELEERLDKLATPPPTAASDLSSLFTQAPTLRTTNPLFEKSKTKTATPAMLSWYEDLLRYASQCTVQEMVDEIRASNPVSTVMNKRISNRLLDALSCVAKDRGVEREELKAAFEKAKKSSGVLSRQYAVIHRKTKAHNQRRRDGKVQAKPEAESDGETYGKWEAVDDEMYGAAEKADENENLNAAEEDEHSGGIEKDVSLSATEELEDAPDVEETEEEQAARALMRLFHESQAILWNASLQNA